MYEALDTVQDEVMSEQTKTPYQLWITGKTCIQLVQLSVC